MLKWIKVRQNTSATTSKSAIPASSILHQETKNDDGARNETEAKIEEEEDSGMEREDSVCNVDLSDLKRVCFYRIFY